MKDESDWGSWGQDAAEPKIEQVRNEWLVSCLFVTRLNGRLTGTMCIAAAKEATRPGCFPQWLTGCPSWQTDTTEQRTSSC